MIETVHTEPFPLALPPAPTIILLSASMSLTSSDTSSKWNQVVAFAFPWPAHFNDHDVLKVLYGVAYDRISFYFKAE